MNYRLLDGIYGEWQEFNVAGIHCEWQNSLQISKIHCELQEFIMNGRNSL